MRRFRGGSRNNEHVDGLTPKESTSGGFRRRVFTRRNSSAGIITVVVLLLICGISPEPVVRTVMGVYVI